MRWGALAVAACVLLAGCAAPFAAPSDGGGGASGDEGDSTVGSGGGNGGGDAAAGGDAAVDTPGDGATPATHEERPDPEADVIGWENGYWHDDSVGVDASDGLNESERGAVVARAMARVELVRNLEFERPVNLTVQTRAETGDEFTGGEPDRSLERFDNAKFRALFLIGGEEDSVGVQDRNRNQTVAGFYSPAREAIVLVSDSSTPRLDGERTLAHELVHALQDQHFGLSDRTPRTRDAYNGHNGLIEGDASAVEAAYMDRCGETWSCLASAGGGTESGSGSGGGSSVHLGVYVISFFPYSDGPGFVESLRDGDDWSDVNDAYADPPRSSAEVISPESYGSFQRADVELSDRTAGGWERVRPAGRPDHGVLGPSALTAMFAYTLYDEYNAGSVVDSEAFLNRDGSGIDTADPFEYSLDPVRGWQGDRLHVYERDGQTGYVWRLVWESPAAADRFVERYRALLGHWGGTEVREDVYVVGADSPFTGAVAVDVEGDTVTVVGAPDRQALGAVRRGV